MDGWKVRNVLTREGGAYDRLRVSVNDRIKDATFHYVVRSFADRIVPAVIFAIGASIFYKICDRLLRVSFLEDVGGRAILVTGCDSGFGKAIVRRLDSMGCHVFACCLTEDGRTQTVEDCSPRTRAVLLDITDQEAVSKVAEFVEENLPESTGLWAVLNNAGISSPTLPVEVLDAASFGRPLSVNLLGMIGVNKVFLDLLRKTKGRIVNTSASTGCFATKFNCIQSVAAHAIEAYSDCLRREIRVFDVSVHIVEPGAFHTKMADDTAAVTSQSWQQATNEMKDLYGEHFDLKRRDSVEETDDLEPVVMAYTHALLGRFPRYRYAVGDDARLGWALSLMPEWISDFMADYLMI